MNDSRGTADGGFAEIPTPDFTTTVIHQHADDIIPRSPADGKNSYMLIRGLRVLLTPSGMLVLGPPLPLGGQNNRIGPNT